MTNDWDWPSGRLRYTVGPIMRTWSGRVRSVVSDPFERFAAQCELRVTVEPISLVPRDVLAPPADADEYFLVTLTGHRPEAGSIRLVVVMPPSTKIRTPTARDALWWLAADAWAIERSEADMKRWADTYEYALGSTATERLFERQVQQTSILRALLCKEHYQRLLELYEREVSASRKNTRTVDENGG